MAKQLSYTDSYGDNYPQSYWRVEQWNFKKSGFAMVLFYGYPDAAHAGKRIIGQKQYMVTPKTFAIYFSATAIDPLNINPQLMAYAFATATLDIDTGQKDQNGNPIMVSFFNEAKDV